VGIERETDGEPDGEAEIEAQRLDFDRRLMLSFGAA
jgi:hypothetical protein